MVLAAESPHTHRFARPSLAADAQKGCWVVSKLSPLTLAADQREIVSVCVPGHCVFVWKVFRSSLCTSLCQVSASYFCFVFCDDHIKKRKNDAFCSVDWGVEVKRRFKNSCVIWVLATKEVWRRTDFMWFSGEVWQEQGYRKPCSVVSKTTAVKETLRITYFCLVARRGPAIKDLWKNLLCKRDLANNLFCL